MRRKKGASAGGQGTQPDVLKVWDLKRIGTGRGREAASAGMPE